MSNIFIFELKRATPSLIIWTVSSIAVMMMFAFMYPTFQDQSQTFVKVLENYPPEVLASLGITIESFTTPVGFYSLVCLYVTIALSIYASIVGLKIFSYEKTHKINEFLMSRPISRTKIFITKYILGILLILMSFTIYSIASILALSFINNSVDIFNLMLINSTILVSMMFFNSISILLANILKKIKVVSAYSIMIVIMFYFITMLSNIIGTDKLKYFTPFSMFSTNEILSNGYDYKALLIVFIFVLSTTLFSYLIFKYKEIK